MKSTTNSQRRALALLGLTLLGLTLPGCLDGTGARNALHEVRDDLGRTIHLPREPRRLVSLAPSVTESLFALGLGDRIVGVSDFCDLPEGRENLARIGGMLNPSLEAIRALDPDLLVGTTSGNDPALASQAAGLGLPLYIIDTPDVNRILESLLALARALGQPADGVRLVDDLRDRLDRVARRVAGRRPPRTLFIIWGEPLVVPGRSAFLTDAIRLAGAESITADAAGAHPTFDLESILTRAPEVILTTPDNRQTVAALRNDPAWKDVPAVASGRIHILDAAIVRPGPGVIRGIEELTAYLHPSATGPGEETGQR